MRIYSWNVNGMRACVRKGFLDWIAACGGDIVAVQEIRALPEQLPASVRELEGWWTHWAPAERKGYSGVGLLARQPATEVETCLGEERFDVEGRLQLARFGALRLINGYFPNGNGVNRDNSRIPYKLDFYRCLFDQLEPARQRGEPILVMGDFNTAHREIDLARPKQNVETSGFRPEERQELDRWLRSGWVDTLREYEAGEGHYTWWSQRKGVRERNIGWRIDYVLASEGALPYLRHAQIHSDVLGSDHCPISIDLDDSVLTAAPGVR